MKLAGGCPSLADQLNVDAFLEQARSYDKASSNPVGWYIRLESDPKVNLFWYLARCGNEPFFGFVCVLLQERSDEGAVAPAARDASPRGGRVVKEPGVPDPAAKNVYMK
jgi:hypothetical protein